MLATGVFRAVLAQHGKVIAGSFEEVAMADARGFLDGLREPNWESRLVAGEAGCNLGNLFIRPSSDTLIMESSREMRHRR
jgi:hypothetical protein